MLKKENKEEILKEEWNKLNQNEVEEPPLFEVCKNKTEEEQKKCFYSTISNHIQNHLANHTFIVKEAINDTVWVPLTITKDNEIVIEDFDIPDIITTQIPDFRNILKQGISTLPQIEAAHIRSTPTSAKYRLPIVINMD